MKAAVGQDPSEPILVLLNPDAGGPRPLDPDRLAASLAAAGIQARVVPVAPGELERRIRASADLDVLGVAGGDGSHRTAAGVLLQSRITLIPLPTGRLNHFARRVGLDSVEAAARAIRAGETERVSVGRVDDAVFLNTAVIGAYPAFVGLRERLRRGLTTWPAAAIASLVFLVRWPRVQLSIRAPDLTWSADTVMLWLGVGRDSFPAPHETPLPSERASLRVVLLSGGRRAAGSLAAFLVGHRLGKHVSPGGRLRTARVPWIEVDSASPIPIALDGEPRLLDPPLRIHFDTGSLRVLVGR